MLKGRAIILNNNDNVDIFPEIPFSNMIHYSNNEMCKVYVDSELKKLSECLESLNLNNYKNIKTTLDYFYTVTTSTIKVCKSICKASDNTTSVMRENTQSRPRKRKRLLKSNSNKKEEEDEEEDDEFNNNNKTQQKEENNETEYYDEDFVVEEDDEVEENDEVEEDDEVEEIQVINTSSDNRDSDAYRVHDILFFNKYVDSFQEPSKDFYKDLAVGKFVYVACATDFGKEDISIGLISKLINDTSKSGTVAEIRWCYNKGQVLEELTSSKEQRKTLESMSTFDLLLTDWKYDVSKFELKGYANVTYALSRENIIWNNPSEQYIICNQAKISSDGNTIISITKDNRPLLNPILKLSYLNRLSLTGEFTYDEKTSVNDIIKQVTHFLLLKSESSSFSDFMKIPMLKAICHNVIMSCLSLINQGEDCSSRLLMINKPEYKIKFIEDDYDDDDDDEEKDLIKCSGCHKVRIESYNDNNGNSYGSFCGLRILLVTKLLQFTRRLYKESLTMFTYMLHADCLENDELLLKEAEFICKENIVFIILASKACLACVTSKFKN